VKEANSRLLREDVDQQRPVLRGLPEIIALHTTERCNLRCTMCMRSLGQGKLQLPRSRLAAICDELFPTARKVALSAAKGEPMLADYDLVMAKARTHAVRVDLVTNGTELTGAAYRDGRDVFDHVNVSVDCAVPEIYERIRVGARFARLLSNLNAIAEERRRLPDDVLLSLSAVVMRSNLPHLPQLVEFARSVAADAVILQPLDHSGKPNHDQDPAIDPGHATVQAMFDTLRGAAQANGVNLFFSGFGLPPLLCRPLRDKLPTTLSAGNACWYVVQHMGIQPTGDVFACCYPTDHLVGNVMLESPRAVWNSRAFQRLRVAHYSRRGTLFCSGCVNAPRLPARRPKRLFALLQKLRFRWSYARNRKRLTRLFGATMAPFRSRED